MTPPADVSDAFGKIRAAQLEDARGLLQGGVETWLVPEARPFRASLANVSFGVFSVAHWSLLSAERAMRRVDVHVDEGARSGVIKFALQRIGTGA